MKIMQCWDDGVLNDAKLVDLCRKYKAKATFNINPGINKKSERVQGRWIFKDKFRVDRLSLDEMKDVYKGFKIAGHTMTHPHPTQISAEQLKPELVDCKSFIKDFFGQGVCGFAYPFGEYNDEVKKAVKDAGYLYARTTKNIDGKLPMDDPMALHSHCHFMNEAFWRKFEEVRKLDGVFYFWGHSYEMMDDPALWDEFEAKLAKISTDSQVEWVDIVDLFA